MASAGRACSGGQQAQGRSRQCPVGAEGAHFGQAIQLVSALVAADLAEQIGQAPMQPGMPGTIVMHGLTQWHYCKRTRADQRTIWRVFARVARRVRVLSVMAFRQPPSSAGRVHGRRLTRSMAKVLPGPRRSTLSAALQGVCPNAMNRCVETSVMNSAPRHRPRASCISATCRR